MRNRRRPGRAISALALAVAAFLVFATFGPALSPALGQGPDDAPASSDSARVSLDAPQWTRGLPGSITVNAPGIVVRPLDVQLHVRNAGGEKVLLASGSIPVGEDSLKLDVTAPDTGATVDVVATFFEPINGQPLPFVTSVQVKTISTLWAFVPPLLAIGLALALRQVIPSLLLGVLAGAWIRGGFSFLQAPARVLDNDLVRALADVDHLKIVLFTLLLGAMIGIVSASGGAGGLVAGVSRWARTRRSGQITGWFAGLAVFFDDYANTLVVGPAMRPLTDELKISREKLAFIVDGTAAPIASVAIISTWVGYEVGLIRDAVDGTALAGVDAYSIFLRSLPYRFYAWLMLGFGLMIPLIGRDFGPMARAEARAALGDVYAPGSQPLTRTDKLDQAPPSSPAESIWLAVAPVLGVVGVTSLALWFTGWASLYTDPSDQPGAFEVLLSPQKLGGVLGSAATFDSLLYGAATGAAIALFAGLLLRRFGVSAGVEAFSSGIAAMTPAMVILTLAWMIGGVCKDLDTAGAALYWIGDGLPARFLPAIVFVLSGAISFATGTSWSTMAVVIPLAIPMADSLGRASGYAEADLATLLVAVTGSVLTGSVWGDHCSPISDTTVLSSTASGCDHMDHVRTQLPYALTVGAVSLLVGDLAVGMGLSPWIGLAVGFALLAGVLMVFGRSAPDIILE